MRSRFVIVARLYPMSCNCWASVAFSYICREGSTCGSGWDFLARMLKSVEQPCDSGVISISIQDKSLEISFLCFKSYHCRTSKSRADVPFVILLFSTDWNLSRELVYFPWDAVHPLPILTPSQALILDKWDLFFNVRIMGSLSMHTESGCPGGALRGRARWEESPKKSMCGGR